MVTLGEVAPDFTLPMARGRAYNDLEPFTLSDGVVDGPVVLAFYPAAFTGGCTEEMCTFRDEMPEFERLDAQVFGVSVDLPFAQNIWIREEALNFPMLSDWNHEVIYAYDVVLPEMYGMIEAAQRSVFVIDTERYVRYAWVRDGENPDFSELVAEVQSAVQGLV